MAPTGQARRRDEAGLRAVAEFMLPQGELKHPRVAFLSAA